MSVGNRLTLCSWYLWICDSVDSKRLRVTFDTKVLTIHTETFSICTRSRFESAHEDVLNLYTETFWIYTRTRTLQHTQDINNSKMNGHGQTSVSSSTSLCSYVSLSRRSLSLALSARLSFFLFVRPVLSDDNEISSIWLFLHKRSWFVLSFKVRGSWSIP